MHLSRDEAAAARRAHWLAMLDEALGEAHWLLEQLTLGDIGLLGLRIASAQAQVVALQTAPEPEVANPDLGHWFVPPPAGRASQTLG